MDNIVYGRCSVCQIIQYLGDVYFQKVEIFFRHLILN